MSELPLQADPREIIARVWPEHAQHLSPPGNRMGGGSIDPDEGMVCNCGQVLGFPTVQDEADYVDAEPERPDTSGVQTGEPDDEPDQPEQPLPCERNPEPHLIAEHDDEAQSMHPEQRYPVLRGTPVSPEQQMPKGWEQYGPDPERDEPKGVMPVRNDGVVTPEDPLTSRVVVIDPTQPYTQADVEHQLLDIAGRLERGIHYQRYWEEREFAAESAYTNKAARIRSQTTGGAKDQRDAQVQVACEEEWNELLLCRAMVRAMRETMHTLRSLQSGYQTVSRSVSDSMRVPAGNRYGNP